MARRLPALTPQVLGVALYELATGRYDPVKSSLGVRRAVEQLQQFQWTRLTPSGRLSLPPNEQQAILYMLAPHRVEVDA